MLYRTILTFLKKLTSIFAASPKVGSTDNPVARLEDWFVTENDLIVGRIFGHPTISDGEIVRTSRIAILSNSKKFAVTQHTFYELGRRID